MTISTPWCHRFAAALLGVALSALWAPTRAQTLKPEAKERFEAGSRAFEVKDYPTALSEFWLGYLLDPKRDFLYAMGQVYRAAGQCDRARAAYEAYKRTRPGRKKATKADANVARCEEAAAPVATAPPAAPPPPEAKPPEAKPPAPPPEPRTIVIERERRPGPWYTDWIGDTLAVSGFVALGVGTFLWVGGRRDLADASKPGRYDDYATFIGDVEAASQKQTVGIVTLAAGGALMTGAALRWWLRPTPPVEEPKVSAGLAPGGGMVFYTTRF